jgi:hypothetical protein
VPLLAVVVFPSAVLLARAACVLPPVYPLSLTLHTGLLPGIRASLPSNQPFPKTKGEAARVAVLGASGYTGAEVARLSALHPHIRITALTGEKQAGKVGGKETAPTRWEGRGGCLGEDWVRHGVACVLRGGGGRRDPGFANQKTAPPAPSPPHNTQPFAEVFPHLGASSDVGALVKIADVDFSAVDAVFCCLPHATTQQIIKGLPAHLKVVDLSADFRLRDVGTYAKWCVRVSCCCAVRPGLVD